MRSKLIAAAMLTMACLFGQVSVGQSVVINKYLNGSPDVVELLVVQDNVDLRGLWIKDFSSSNANDGGGGYQFNNIAFWNGLRAGTLIVLRQNATAADITVSCTDFNLDLGLTNTTYFTAGTGTFDISTNDMVMIKSGTQSGVANNIHTLRAGAAAAQWTGIASGTRLGTTSTASAYALVDNASSVIGDFNLGTTGVSVSATGTLGSGNNTNNTNFINFLRGPVSAAASGVGGTSFTANWASVTGAASYVLDVSTSSTFASFVSGYNSLNVGNVTSYLVNSGISGLTTYYYRIRAVNATPTTSGNSCTQTLTTTAAGVPNLNISGTPTNHGSSCIGIATSTVTYTITNSGTAAAGITVVSSNTPEFLVSNLSSTSIAGSGGTATYDVTFTPSASGARSATITVASTTSGSNSPTSSLTGTGLATVAPVVSTSAASPVVNTTATLNGTLTTLGVCPSTTQKGFVYSQTSVNSNPLNAGTGVTTAPVAGLVTGAYTLGLTSLTPNTSYSFKAYEYNGTTYTYGTVQTFTTLTPADHLAFGTAPAGTGSVGSNLTTFTVEARRADNSVDAEYTASVGLTRNIVSGSGNLTGTTSVAAVAGVATFSAVQFDAAGTYTITASSGALTTITSSNIVVTLANSTIVAWTNTGASTAWCNANWSSSVPSAGEVAQFNNSGSATLAGITFSTCVPSIAAIEVTSARTRILTVGSSSSAAGVLTLNGGVVNSVPNVILKNSSAFDFTLQPNVSSSGAMSIALGNTTNNLALVEGTGSIAISAIISGSNPLTKSGSGAGVLVLTGANSYTGLTTVTTGTLQLNRTGGTTIPVTNNVTINGGTLKVSTNQTIANLTMSSGSLVVDAGATLTITGTYNVTGGTINNLGTLNLNGGSYSFPGTGVNINNGTAGTLAGLTVASSGTITMSGDFTVSGTLTLTSGALAINGHTLTLGGTVSRTSGNLAGGNTSNLVIGGTAGSLFFDGTGTNNYLSSLTVNNGASATLGNALNITAYNGTAEGVLTVTGTGTLASAGFLTIKSNVNGTAYIAAGRTTGGYITGNVSVERFLPQNSSKGWRLLASNTSGQTINAAWQEGAVGGMVNPNPGFGTMITAGGSITTSLATAQAAGFDTLSPGVSLFKYNPATDVLDPVTATNTGNISSEQGYFVFVSGDRGPGQFSAGAPTSSTVLRSKGTLFTGDQTAVATGAQNYALMRNPYPSRIDMRQIVRGSNLIDAFQVWDAKLGGTFGVGGFQTFSKSGGNYVVTPGNGSYGSNGSVQNFIESGAAFYIQSVSNASNNTAQVVEAAKASASSNNSFRPTAGEATVAFNLYANNAGNFDGVDGGLVFFDNTFSNAVDINDVRKSFNFNENFGVVRDNIQLVVEKREATNINDTIFFSMGQMRQQGYRLDIQANAIDPLITTAILEDSYTNTNTMLDLGVLNSYNFTVDATAASKAANRFRLVFRQSSVVPVTFVGIKAAQAGNNILVGWNVANELNITRYEVEKSTDGSYFSKKGTVAAMKLTAYNWTDENVSNGYNYYRIKSVDNNGQVKYSQTVKVMIGGKAGIAVSPNPVQGNFVNIRFTDKPAGKYAIKITNIAGQTVYNRQLIHDGGSSSQSFVLPLGLVKGLYQLEIVAPDNVRFTEKLIISQGN